MYLNLAPGLVSVTDVLGALVDAIPIEAARVMTPDDGDDPPIFADFRALLGGIELGASDGSRSTTRPVAPDVALAIATGEQRLYANLLLTIGVVSPD